MKKLLSASLAYPLFVFLSGFLLINSSFALFGDLFDEENTEVSEEVEDVPSLPVPDPESSEEDTSDTPVSDEVGADDVSASSEDPLEPSENNASDLFVVEASHIEAEKVKVTMSQPILLENPLEGFILEKQGDRTPVSVNTVVANGEEVFILLSETLVADESYQVLATSAVSDLEGNPLSSGVTDTVVFVARGSFPENIVEETAEEPSEESSEETEEFSPEETNQEASLEAEQEIDAFESLEDIEDTTQGAETSEATDPVDAFINNFDSDGLLSSGDIDTVAPQDVQNFSIEKGSIKTEEMVVLNWEPAIDLDKDIVDQVLYTQIGLGDWDRGYSLGKDLNSLEMQVEKDQNYKVRLVTVDVSGNKSEGVTLSFSTHLAQSGGSFLFGIGLAVAFMLGLLFLFGNRRS